MRAWDSITGLEHNSMQAKALEVYLKRFYDLLTKCELSPSFNIVQATREITQIFHHLYAPLVSSRENAWIANKLDEVRIHPPPSPKFFLLHSDNVISGHGCLVAHCCQSIVSS